MMGSGKSQVSLEERLWRSRPESPNGTGALRTVRHRDYASSPFGASERRNRVEPGRQQERGRDAVGARGSRDHPEEQRDFSPFPGD
ncbi:hypothetical protein SAV31267_096320 [Streptomyces avermitilis]|uniref:Uncharacterized protein n=1 Tax=Streptomyces avermitilis TaxID=33903 RepID=A0A4D4NAG6_STRAX|nr:hypothetical protein SAVMC3_03730 [Streptomyces avermitilis]GDY80147.1 hypothetical protein SAV31267_096320 [Streptomyces avermitilis]